MVFASNICNSISVTIKTINSEHTCGRDFEKIKYVNSAWLAEKYVSKFEADPKWKRASFNKDVRDDMGLDASIWQYYRAKKRALEKIQGSTQEQYSRLWDYYETLKDCCPGTTVKLKLHADPENPHFERLYVRLGTCKQGWREDRQPIIGLDGCHVKGLHTG